MKGNFEINTRKNREPEEVNEERFARGLPRGFGDNSGKEMLNVVAHLGRLQGRSEAVS